MHIGSKNTIYTDLSALNNLKQIARDDPNHALRKVAEQFEAIFMKMMLKSMRDASFGNPLFDSSQSEMYQDMFDNQISLSLSTGRSNGLADILVEQLGSSLLEKPLNNDASKIKYNSQHNITDKQKFINLLKPYSEKAAKSLGTKPELLIAQAALETGWGKGIQHFPDGRNGFNLFNIKADENWQGPTTIKNTLEYKDGITERERTTFRAYSSYAESFNDYVGFIKENSRYHNALNNSSNVTGYIQALADSGYATDPKYAEKIIKIFNDGNIKNEN